MSTSPRSYSSSPDILGPPGDAQYLISSPIKPFVGRQSWMSPMVGKSKSRTPAKRPRSRVSLSPAKSAHSIKFSDVILPGSPTMKLNGGRQRSISPEKLQQDGNVSPWRIRLTLEATQDEEDENRGSPSRKRIKPSTVTTMIPLKDERSPLMEKTPLRRRGRPRKSDMTLSPFLGGPGNTPRPGNTPGPGHTPGPKVEDSQPRKRGRPRGTPKPKQQDFEMVEDEPTPTVEHTEPFSPMDIVLNSETSLGHQFSPMDTITSEAGLERQSSPMDTGRSEAGVDYQAFSPSNAIMHEAASFQRRYSPMNTVNSDADRIQEQLSPTDSFAGSNAHASPIDLVGDAVASDDDSWGNSEMSIADLGDPTELITNNTEPPRREYGRTSLDTPVIGATEHHFLDDENIHSTPSKMPSPTRERAIRSSRSSHDMASPQSRTYPTPTPTSSLADEESQAQENDVDQHAGTDVQPAEADAVDDPTDDHEEYEEYDTIMESEGFTMISLDTLPSAKQHGFGSSAMTNGGPKPKEVGDRLKRKLPGTIEDLRSDSHARKSSSPLSTNMVPGSHERTKTHISDNLAANANARPIVNHVKGVTYPELPAVPSPAKVTIAPKKKTFTSLAKLVRVALALQGPFRPQGHEWSGQNNVQHKRQRLQGLFSTFGIETRRELSIAMGLGQEIAVRRMIEEEAAAAAVAAERAAARFEEQEEPHDDEFDELELDQSLEGEVEQARPFANKAEKHKDTMQSPHFRPNNSMQQSPMSQQKRQREIQWQLEREAVSRQAQMASASRSVVYIDSDDNVPEAEEADEPGAGLSYDDQPQLEPKLKPQPASHLDPEVDNQPDPVEDEDDGYDDIWQLEANEHSYSQHSEDDNIQSHPIEPPTPLGNLYPAPAGRERLSSSPQAPSEHDLVARLGPSKVRELREQKVDLSALLAQEDTPNRARYYNGTSTPRSVLSRPSGTQHLPLNSSVVKQTVSRTPAHIRLQPLSQSSPEIGSPQVSFHEWENSQAIEQSPAEELPLEDAHVRSSSAARSPSNPAQPHSTSTPGPRRPNEEAPGSSWFSKITSFTPQWLKAPNHFRSSSVTTIPEEQSDSEGEEDLAGIESAKELNEQLHDEMLSNQGRQSPASHWQEASHSPRAQQHLHPTMEEEEQPIYERSSSRHLMDEHEEPGSERDDLQNLSEDEDAEPVTHQNEASPGPRPLAAFGYFSDEHYVALRRIYRIAKRYPERFEYYDAPGRAAIIGDWIWTSDGHHGVPITEIQFAIIDRFAQDLSRADIQYGGSGHIDWTEADLHRRLISIIIGEQIRDERKAKANRGASVDTWR